MNVIGVCTKQISQTAITGISLLGISIYTTNIFIGLAIAFHNYAKEQETKDSVCHLDSLVSPECKSRVIMPSPFKTTRCGLLLLGWILSAIGAIIFIALSLSDFLEACALEAVPIEVEEEVSI